MLRKTLTIVFLVGLAVGLGLFLNMGTSYYFVTLSAGFLLITVSKELHECPIIPASNSRSGTALRQAISPKSMESQ